MDGVGGANTSEVIASYHMADFGGRTPERVENLWMIAKLGKRSRDQRGDDRCRYLTNVLKSSSLLGTYTTKVDASAFPR